MFDLGGVGADPVKIEQQHQRAKPGFLDPGFGFGDRIVFGIPGFKDLRPVRPDAAQALRRGADRRARDDDVLVREQDVAAPYLFELLPRQQQRLMRVRGRPQHENIVFDDLFQQQGVPAARQYGNHRESRGHQARPVGGVGIGLDAAVAGAFQHFFQSHAPEGFVALELICMSVGDAMQAQKMGKRKGARIHRLSISLV